MSRSSCSIIRISSHMRQAGYGEHDCELFRPKWRHVDAQSILDAETNDRKGDLDRVQGLERIVPSRDVSRVKP